MRLRTRMFKTLGWLAIAMTGCLWLLTWLEPPDRAVAMLTAPGFLRQQTLQALKTDRGVVWRSWRDIELVSANRNLPGQATLTAVPGVHHHFVVSRRGLVRAGRAWKHQQFIGGPDSPIIVAMMGITDHDELGVAQWLGLRTLLGVLREHMFHSGAGCCVRIRRTLGFESPQVVRALHELLGIEGFRVDIR